MPRKKGRPPVRQPGDALSIQEFCQSNGISLSTFYKLKREGLAPRMMKIGGRYMIAPEAMEDWRRAREKDSES
jgi:predicted DNA-binding transcriptional regulator AlpA